MTTFHAFGLQKTSFKDLAKPFLLDPQYVEFERGVPDKVDTLFKHEVTTATKGTSYIVKVEDGKKPVATFYKPVTPLSFVVPLLRTAEGVYAMMNPRFPGEEGYYIYPGSEERGCNTLSCIKGRGKFSVTTNKGDTAAVKVTFGGTRTKPSDEIDAVVSSCQIASGKQFRFLEIDLKEHILKNALKKLRWNERKCAFKAIPLTPYLKEKQDFVEKYGIPTHCNEITDALFKHLTEPKKKEKASLTTCNKVSIAAGIILSLVGVACAVNAGDWQGALNRQT